MLTQFVQHPFGFGLDSCVEGQLNRLAVFRVAEGLEADRVTERVVDQLALAVDAVKRGVLAQLETGQALAVLVDRADELAGKRALGAGADRVRMLADAFEPEFIDLGRMGEIDLALHVGEATGSGDRLEHVVRVGVEGLGDRLGLGLGILDLVRRGVDAGALFGAG